MAISLEELESMFEDWRATLYAIVHPGCTKFAFVEGDGGCLAAADIHALDDCDFEFVWVVGEGIGTGLAMSVEGLRWVTMPDHTMPAAPAPTMTTFFLPLLGAPFVAIL